jgi:hypothetical protein
MKNIFLSSLFLSLFIACTTETVVPESISNLEDIKVELSKSKTLDFASDKVTINVKAINDSRCPKGVTCLWQGEARLTLDVSYGTNSYKDVKLCLDCSTTDKTPSKTQLMFGSQAYTLSLMSIEPFPTSVNPSTTQYGIFAIK